MSTPTRLYARPHRITRRLRSLKVPLAGVSLLAASLAIVGLVVLAPAPPAMAEEAASAGDAVYGKHAYRSFCSSCHGKAGEGDGDLAEYLTIVPTDLTLLAATNGGTFPTERVRKVIDGREKVPGHGGGDMPAWGYAFRELYDQETVDEKIDQLVAYLQTIQADAESAAR